MSEPQTTQLPPLPVHSPKDNFLKQEDYANRWRQFARTDLASTALTHALAEYASTCPSSEQLNGVQNFVRVLLNLAEPKSPPLAPFPDKRLVSPVTPEPSKPSEKKK